MSEGTQAIPDDDEDELDDEEELDELDDDVLDEEELDDDVEDDEVVVGFVSPHPANKTIPAPNAARMTG